MRISHLLYIALIALFVIAVSEPCLCKDDWVGKKLKAGDRDPEFLKRVNQAVKNGVKYLRKLQSPSGKWRKSTAWSIRAPTS